MNERETMDVETALRSRHAVRSFLPTPVDRAGLRRAFEAARWTPSNCNTQPWLAKIVSGAGLERMKSALLEDVAVRRESMDVPFDISAITGIHRDRMVKHAETLGHARKALLGDADAHRNVMEDNVQFFGAPHAAFFFMPAWGNERQASDLGMYVQSLALALIAQGVGSCPQTCLGLFADTVHRELGVGRDYKLLFGMSIGYPNTSSPVCRIDQGRNPVDDLVEFIDR